MSMAESVDLKTFKEAKKGGKEPANYTAIRTWVWENFLKKDKAPSEQTLKRQFKIKLRTLVRLAKLNGDRVRYRTIKGQRFFIIEVAKGK